MNAPQQPTVRAALLMAKHSLDPDYRDADRNDACVCGGWVSGPMGPGWDDHLAEVLAEAGLLASDTGQAREPAFTDSLGVSAIVRVRRDVLRYPAGTIGLVTRQARNGPNRYAVMIPGDPFEYSVAAKDLEVVQGVERWWHRDCAGAVPDTGQADEVLKLRWEVQQLQGIVQDQHRAIAAVRSLCADAMKLPTLEDPRPADDRVSPRAVLAALDRAGPSPDTEQARETGADRAARPRRFSPEDTLSVRECLGAAAPSGDIIQAATAAERCSCTATHCLISCVICGRVSYDGDCPNEPPLRALLGTDTTPDRLAWIDTAAGTAAVERQARYQETACARRPAEEHPDA